VPRDFVTRHRRLSLGAMPLARRSDEPSYGNIAAVRDDFSETVKRNLGRRVAYRCSRPDCRAPTLGPQVDPEKSINVGVAAHISAAAPKGPRFDAEMSPDARASSSNGIWLCQNCAKLIDSDPTRYSCDVLFHWKAVAEAKALDELGQSQRRVFKEDILAPDGPRLPPPSVSATPSAQQAERVASGKRHLRVFIAYSVEDRDRAQQIATTLRATGVEPWLVTEQIEAGTNWHDTITAAIGSSDVVLVLFSEATATKRGYVQREIRTALDIAQELPETAVYLIPVRLDDTPAPREFAAWQWLDMNAPNAADRLMRALTFRAAQVGAELPTNSASGSNAG
jgi:hypothetical protein